MTPKEKLKYFDYFLYKLVEYYKKGNQDINENDLSVLKSMKLLFFVTAIETTTTPNLLDSVFDKFCAMPYGHVESDVYNQLRENNGILTLNKINSQKTEILNANLECLVLDKLYTELIDNNLSKLFTNYPKLINLKAFQLVDLSHKWYSWIQAIKEAQKIESWSKPIEPEMIKREQKIFSL